MNSPILLTLAAIDFTGVSGAPLTIYTDLEGAIAISFDFEFKWASSATPTGFIKAQTSFDGTNWRDILRHDFAQTSIIKNSNFVFTASKGITTYSALGSEGVYDNVFGNQIRAVPSWTGSYAGSTLSLRANVR